MQVLANGYTELFDKININRHIKSNANCILVKVDNFNI